MLPLHELRLDKWLFVKAFGEEITGQSARVLNGRWNLIEISPDGRLSGKSAVFLSARQVAGVSKAKMLLTKEVLSYIDAIGCASGSLRGADS